MENNERIEEQEVESTDYLAAIKELKKNTVGKEKYDQLLEENKRLLDTVVNGQYVEEEESPKETIQDLRNKVFNTPEPTNLEYITNALKLRNALIEEGYEDPFVPQGEQAQATMADRMLAEKVANGLQEMVDEAEGDPDKFIALYSKRVKEKK